MDINNSMAVTMTVGQLRALIRSEVDEAVRPIRERIEKDGTGIRDVRGVGMITSILNITPDSLVKIVRSGVLGNVLWKDTSKGKNAAVHGTMPMMQSRFKALMNFEEGAQKAWMMLGGDLAEKKWKEIGY